MIVLGNILKRILGKKSNLIFMLILPTLMNVFFIYVTTIDTKYKVGIVDNDATQFTQDFTKYMKKNCKVIMLTKDDDIKSAIINDSLESVLVIEEGYTAALIDGRDMSIKSYSKEDSSYSGLVQANVASYISSAKTISLASMGDEGVFYQGIEEYNKKPFSVDYLYSSLTDSAGISAAMTSFGYIAFCLVYLMTSSTALLMEEKVSGVTDRIFVSPVRRASYYIQHMLSSFIISIIQIVVIILILPLVSTVSYGSNITDILEVIFICSVFSIACISIGTAINKYSKNKKVSGSITSLINLPMLMLGGCLWSSDLMPEVLQKIGAFMPTTWFMNASDKIIHGGSLMDAKVWITYLLAFSLVLFIITFLPRSQKS